LLRGLLAALAPVDADATIHIPGVGNCMPVRSGRAGIVIALQSLGIPPGSYIATPLYNCPVVAKAIVTAGMKPCFVEIDSSTYCMSPPDLAKKADKVAAVIAVHMFGNACDVQCLRTVVGDKPIIEDCAQSLGTRIGDRPAGTLGDAAVFSFRSGKYLSVGEGAAVFSSSEPIRKEIHRRVAALAIPSRNAEVLHVIKTYVRSKLRGRHLYGPLGLPLWAAYNRRTPVKSQTPVVLGRIYAADLITARHRLKTIDAAIACQRAHADIYTRMLSLPTATLCAELPDTFVNRYLYPLLLPTEEMRDSMADQLMRHRIGSIKPYQDSAGVGSDLYGYAGHCPVTEDICRRVLAVPSHQGLSAGTVRRIAACVNNAWSGAHLP
jgi:dTDP-4-amino-4,6-dideoxygalactose transaminase